MNRTWWNIGNEWDHWKFLIRERKFLAYLTENLLFDVQNGTNTCGWLRPEDFVLEADNLRHGVRYRASHTSILKQAFDQAAAYPQLQGAAFYDLGCGKGKGVIMATRTGYFSSVNGLDYYPRFLDIARENLQKTGLDGRDDIRLIHADASTFTDYAPVSVVYMYNPFDQTIVDPVRRNIETSAERALVLYNKPLHGGVFENAAGWTLKKSHKHANDDRNLNVYAYGFQP